MKITTALAGAAVLVGSLTACGGGTDAYCDDLATAEEEFASLGEGDFASFDELTETAQELGDAAPDEVADDWETLNAGLEEFNSVLDEAGVAPEDLEGMAAGEIPEDLDAEALQQLGEELQSFGDEELTAATDAISEHADTECGIQLDDSSE